MKLQERLCGKNSYSNQVLDPKFFDRQWAALLRKTLFAGQVECLDLLMAVHRSTDTGLPWYPALPRQFVNWLVKSADGGIHLHTLNDSLARHIYTRLEKSEVSISTVDGMEIMRRGGARTALFQTSFRGLDPDLPKIINCPPFEKAWTKWRQKKANIEITMEYLRDEINKHHCDDRHILNCISELVEVQKPARKKEILTTFHDMVQRSHICLTIDSSSVLKMLRVIETMKRLDGSFDENRWENWNSRVCRAMETQHTGWRITHHFIKMLTINHRELNNPPAGFFFNDQILQTMMRDNDNLIRFRDAKQNGLYISDLTYEDIVIWLRDRKRVWDKLQQWGLVSYQDRAKWKSMVDDVMGSGWVGKFSQELAARGDIGQYVHASFNEWKLWELEAIAPDLQQLPERKIKM